MQNNLKDFKNIFLSDELTGQINLPVEFPDTKHVYNQFVIRVVSDRDKLITQLRSFGVGTEVYYPLSLHLQECFKYLKYSEGTLLESEIASSQTLALPIYPELPEESIDYVVEKIRSIIW